jgi:predicted RNA-binding protein with PIN domain
MRRITKKYLIIDGYNYINADPFLKDQMGLSLESARHALNQMLSEYASYTGELGIVVYDAMKSDSYKRRIERHGGIEVVFTRKLESADSYIERTVHELSRDKSNLIRVVTMDWAEQIAVFSLGAIRVSASDFKRELDGMKENLREMSMHTQKNSDRQLGSSLDSDTMKKLESLLKPEGKGREKA